LRISIAVSVIAVGFNPLRRQPATLNFAPAILSFAPPQGESLNSESTWLGGQRESL